jgi:hypothetical protein
MDVRRSEDAGVVDVARDAVLEPEAGEVARNKKKHRSVWTDMI